MQVFQLCRKAGIVKLGHIAIDGSKILANASKHKAMSYDVMCAKEKTLELEINDLLGKAQQVDTEEDSKYGQGIRGDDLPAELQRRESRLKKIQEAKAMLEAEAKAEAKREADESKKKTRRSQYELTDEEVVPLPKSQKNFTDPDSRIMPDNARKGSFIQCYNVQIAVDSEAQAIVATGFTQKANDRQQLVPMAEKIIENCGSLANVTSADSGYFSDEAMSKPTLQGTTLLVPPNRVAKKEGETLFCGPVDEHNVAPFVKKPWYQSAMIASGMVFAVGAVFSIAGVTLAYLRYQEQLFEPMDRPLIDAV